MKDFITIDFETANSERTSACQIGLALVRDFKIVSSESYLIKPAPYYFDYFNTQLHGIDEAKVKDCPNFKEIWPSIKGKLSGFIFAHNASFDISVLRKTLDYYEIDYPELEYSCSYQLSKKYRTGLLSYKLDQVCKALNIEFSNHHDAKYDAIACAEILVKIFKDVNCNNTNDIKEKFNIRTGALYQGGYDPSLSVSRSQYKRQEIDFDKSKISGDSNFFEKNVVFTGTLSSMSRREAQKLVLESGGKCPKAVTSTTNFLVLGEQDFSKFGEGFKSSKIKKAESILLKGGEIELLSEMDFIELL